MTRLSEMPRKLRVYIASPFSIGDQLVNLQKHVDMYNDLLNRGFLPYAPLLHWLAHMSVPRSHKFWLDQDLEWVRVCDALLRMPGESVGADMEVELAKSINIPVCYTVTSLEEWRQGWLQQFEPFNPFEAARQVFQDMEDEISGRDGTNKT